MDKSGETILRLRAECGALRQAADKLEAERDRYKAALEEIRSKNLDCPSCCSAEMAQNALHPTTVEPVAKAKCDRVGGCLKAICGPDVPCKCDGRKSTDGGSR